MTEAVRGYLLSVSAAAILLAMTQEILPQNAVRRVAAFLGGLLLILAVLSPVVKVDADRLRDLLPPIPAASEDVTAWAEQESRERMASLIKEKCETYILDKAGQLGMTIAAEVRLSEEEGYPVPDGAVLTGSFSPAQQQSLQLMLSEELGIPPQRQEWRAP